MDKRDEMPLYCKSNVTIVTMFIREYLYMVKSYLLSLTLRAHRYTSYSRCAWIYGKDSQQAS